ncbi:uncharacterized protein BYT42DRAFT_548329 [Radiomyces spectabilis]|uniref:uncharacterized protein n=1 Tax=Radiomyces spectabilis TaxID=64574 RepID=UPI002220B27E|nr:uncharacterized protein BYT42DRAFT_548329 [Radiomyces spectabilis]KAI8371466.1 hypothetical protein BYT42DRAFT_548329 [Radiomyces spectabilis]
MTVDDSAIVSQVKALGVVPLTELTATQQADVYGIVKMLKPARQCANGRRDWQLTFQVIDPSIQPQSKISHITSNLFYESQDWLPAIQGPGDIVICKNVVLRPFNGTVQVQKIANRSTFIVVDPDTLKQRPNAAYAITPTENDWKMIRLYQQWAKDRKATDRPLPTMNMPSQPKITHLRTDELQPNYFPYFDYVGQVVAVNLQGPCMVFLLTDYTENPQPMDDEDLPTGVDARLLVQCTLWDENVRQCPAFQHGDFIHLRNCKVKQSAYGQLELAVHGEKNLQRKFRKVFKLDPADPLLAQLQTRREAYEANKRQKRRKVNSIHEITVGVVRTVHKHQTMNYSSNQTVMHTDELPKKWKIRAYLTDYHPSNAKDWVVKWCSRCDRSYGQSSTTVCEFCKSGSLQYTYSACLLAQDAQGVKIPIYCYGKDTISMFPDMPPCENRSNKK